MVHSSVKHGNWWKINTTMLATLIIWPPGVASSCTGPVAAAAQTGTSTDITCWMPALPPDPLVPAETGINSCCSGNEPEFWVPAARIIWGVVDWPSSCDTDCVEFVRIGEITPEIDSANNVHLSRTTNFSKTLTFAISSYNDAPFVRLTTHSERMRDLDWLHGFLTAFHILSVLTSFCFLHAVDYTGKLVNNKHAYHSVLY